jgi:hypothetical protein
MKTLCYFAFSIFFFFVSSFLYAETKTLLVSSIYFLELLIVGGVSLALILVFILMLKERSYRVKKMAQIYEDFDQKTSVMQMMMNSVREKEKNIIKIVESLQLQSVAEDSVTNNESNILAVNVEGVGHEKQDVFIDPRTLDVNGKVKQPHLGRSNYLLAMRNAHSQGLSCVIRIEEALQVAIADAVNGAEGNLQEIDSFYQKLSELIEALELESGSEVIKPSSQNMIEALSNIQYDFEELMKYQKYNQSAYERLTKRLVEKPYSTLAKSVATVLEN